MAAPQDTVKNTAHVVVSIPLSFEGIPGDHVPSAALTHLVEKVKEGGFFWLKHQSEASVEITGISEGLGVFGSEDPAVAREAIAETLRIHAVGEAIPPPDLMRVERIVNDLGWLLDDSGIEIGANARAALSEVRSVLEDVLPW